ncbi:MAG: gliding motility-associated C-terminal domain-containing protein [Chitinophagaceae bacterium]|nr:gliding motility-associated C-terminal domain-containing protein [Chitinophagaceae bacterium]
MKKILLVIFILFVSTQMLKAGHIAGGELFYKYISTNGTTNRYELTLRLFRDCDALLNPGGSRPPDLPSSVALGIFIGNTNTAFIDSIFVAQSSTNDIILQAPNPCITNPRPVCYKVALYKTTVDLPVNALGYTIAFQTCCRVNGLSNGGVSQGATYAAYVPGSIVLGTGHNSSPEFEVKDTVLICKNKRFSLPFSANDPDGDSLSYSFCNAFASTGIGDATIRKPLAPPYNSISYTNGYSGTNPLSAQVGINTSNGVISGIAPSGFINPNGSAYFVVNVCITEWRNSKQISQHRKDFVIRISDCDFADAELPVDNRSCDGFTYTFENLTNSNLVRTWSWDFGVPSVLNDTSDLTSPAFTYADTGVYKVRLIVNRGEVCTDTSYSNIYVFPGFNPEFEYYNGCKNVPIQFMDKTTSAFGFADKWFWDFGVNTSLADTSILKNPLFTYTQNGTYTVKLLAGSNKGCLDTVSHPLIISDKPPIQLTNDTLICSIDTLQLNALGQGSFVWAPNYNINNLNIPNPLVSPDVKTKYYVTLTLAPGCVNTDSVVVDVKDFVILLPLRDTTICRGDPVTFKPVSDGLYYNWSPPNLFTNPQLKNATAVPALPSTLFTVVSSIGKCNSSTTVTVKTIPYPIVDAGPQKDICFKDTAILTGSGNASSWLWAPARFVSNTRTITTKAFPINSTQFILRGTDTLGCPKPVFDTVLVRVIPPVPAFAGNDTAVVVGQPLQLKGSGATFYQWLPPKFLNANDIGNPVAVFDAGVEKFSYIMKATTPEGCFAFDTINIKIFKTAPDIFVPTAFTPDANNLNDVFIPIAVGITKLDYFRVFNRWGNMLYSTTVLQQGWDGTYKGLPQAPDTYVWMVRGADFTGKTIIKKGTVVLIR